jgi:hypothetical protein
MSKKKPFYKTQKGWAYGDSVSTSPNYMPHNRHTRVRVVDARELTPEKAVEKVLQLSYSADIMNYFQVEYAASHVGMTATITNGKVRVRKIKEAKR